MEILVILENNDNVITAYTPNKLSFQTIKNNIRNDINKKYVLCVEHEFNRYQMDLNRMLNKIPGLLNSTDWNDFINRCPEDSSQYYPCPTVVPYLMWDINTEGRDYLKPTEFRINNVKSPLIHSCTHDFGITGHYGSIGTPIRDEYYLKWLLKDLILSHDDIQHPKVDFTNTVPIVNGVTCTPYFFNDELYILDAAKYFKSANGINKTITLLDFTPFGGIEIVRLKDCLITDVGNEYEKMIKLPSNKNMENKTPILVISGRMFFRNEIVQYSDTALLVDVKLLGLDWILLTNDWLSGKFVFNTLTVINKGVKDYLTNYIGTENDTDNFIILIDNPNVNIIKTPYIYNLYLQGIKFDNEAVGLLVNNITREIEEYTYIEYDNSKLATITWKKLFHFIKRTNPDHLDENVGFVKTLKKWYKDAICNCEYTHSFYDIVSV